MIEKYRCCDMSAGLSCQDTLNTRLYRELAKNSNESKKAKLALTLSITHRRFGRLIKMLRYERLFSRGQINYAALQIMKTKLDKHPYLFDPYFIY